MGSRGRFFDGGIGHGVKACLCVSIFTLLVSPLFCARAANGTAGDAHPNAILIGWDGAQRQHVKEALARGQLPNLGALSREGTIVAIDILRETGSKAGWAQILTGYEPETTHVFSNSNFGAIPKGYTIFERLEGFFGPESMFTAAVISKYENLGTLPAGKRPVTDLRDIGRIRGTPRGARAGRVSEGGQDSVKYVWAPAQPFWLTKDSVDVFLNGLGPDDSVGVKAQELLSEAAKKHFFFFIQLGEIDEAGHIYGENSSQYDAALESADKWLGSIVAQLKSLGIYDRTLIYVVSDHGFDEGRNIHSDAPYAFLATNDATVMRAGGRADIAPTIMERMGLDLSKISPALDGHPLSRPYESPKW